jgi:VanZ family protein
MKIHKWFRYISIIQLFIATGVCIFFSSQENITLPNIHKIDLILHFGAYFIYGLSLQVFFIALFYNKSIRRRKYLIFTILIGFLFAISDEIHQYFVPSRSADIYDLIMDWCGISLSLIFFNIVRKNWKSILEKK